MKKMSKKTQVFLTACVLASVMTGCGTGQETEKEKLTVCTGSIQADQVYDLIDAWQELGNGIETEVIVIPEDDETLAETRITELRTEIMSGGGPDVFLLPCNINENEENAPELFPNPEKAMYSDLFLPLDDYILNATYMDPAGWNQTIMDSGKTKEGQLLLPLTYRYYAYIFSNADLENPQGLPESWEEFINYENPAFTDIAGTNNLFAIPYTLGRLADYQEEKLLFSEDDLQKRVEEIFTRYENSTADQTSIKPLAYGDVGRRFCETLDAVSTEDKTAFILPNDEGGVTAYVTAYAAVNRNSKNPDQAFSLLDFLFSDEIMTGDGFPGDDSQIRIGSDCNIQDNYRDGISVNLEAAQRMSKNPSSTVLLEQMDRRISEVRYYSTLENALYWMAYRCLAWDKDHEPPLNAEERREVIHQTYQEMGMQLAE